MGPLLELLATPDTSLINDFGESVTLTHRAYWFTLNPFGDLRMQAGDGALYTSSALGKVVNGTFRPFPPSVQSAVHTVAETRAILSSPGNFLANVVAAHKVKIGLVMAGKGAHADRHDHRGTRQGRTGARARRRG